MEPPVCWLPTQVKWSNLQILWKQTHIHLTTVTGIEMRAAGYEGPCVWQQPSFWIKEAICSISEKKILTQRLEFSHNREEIRAIILKHKWKDTVSILK